MQGTVLWVSTGCEALSENATPSRTRIACARLYRLEAPSGSKERSSSLISAIARVQLDVTMEVRY